MARFQVEPYDLVGVGFGPANIGLAVALEESGWSGSTLFLERLPAPDWQPGMLLDVAFDEKGDIDRESYLVEVRDGKQVVTDVLPPLGGAK